MLGRGTSPSSPSSTAVSSRFVSVLTRRAVAQVLEPLAGGDPDALLLLADVRHERRNARARRAAGMVANANRALPPGAPRPTTHRRSYRRSPHAGDTASVPTSRRIEPTRRPSYTRAGGGAGTPSPPGALDGDLLLGDRPLPRARASSARSSPSTTSASRARSTRSQIAFLVPNTIRALVADAALSSAFVPVFSELLEKGERKRAWRVASSAPLADRCSASAR